METVKSGAFVVVERKVIQERSANKHSVEHRELTLRSVSATFFGMTLGIQIGEWVIHFDASDAPTQDTGGRFDFLGGFPMGHVGVAAFATLTAFNFLCTSCTHKTLKP